jgi:PepSY-associated TM region
VSRRLRLAHKIWLNSHLYLGLTVGLELVLVGLTGSVLVFHRDIDAWLNPTLLTTQGSGAHQSLDCIFAAARTAMPEAQGKDASVSVPMPFCAGGTDLVWVKVPLDRLLQKAASIRSASTSTPVPYWVCGCGGTSSSASSTACTTPCCWVHGGNGQWGSAAFCFSSASSPVCASGGHGSRSATLQI